MFPSTSSEQVESRPVCFCGFAARVFTSKTPKNPARRFAKCPKGACKMWLWLDPEPSPEVKSLIARYDKKIAVRDAEIRVLKMKFHFLAALLFVSWIAFLVRCVI